MRGQREDRPVEGAARHGQHARRPYDVERRGRCILEFVVVGVGAKEVVEGFHRVRFAN